MVSMGVSTSRALWAGGTVVLLVAMGGLAAVGAQATTARATAEAQFTEAQTEGRDLQADRSLAETHSAELMATAADYSTWTTAALPQLGALDTSAISTEMTALDTLASDAPIVAVGTAPIARADWSTGDYLDATQLIATLSGQLRTSMAAVSDSSSAVQAQLGKVDAAVAALVNSVPTTSATLLSEKSKADQAAKDALASAAAAVTSGLTLAKSFDALAVFASSIGPLSASHDAAVAAEAAAGGGYGSATNTGLFFRGPAEVCVSDAELARWREDERLWEAGLAGPPAPMRFSAC